MAYNWQPPHKLTPTDTIGIMNTNNEIPKACVDQVSHCGSKRTKFSFISVKNKSQNVTIFLILFYLPMSFPYF